MQRKPIITGGLGLVVVVLVAVVLAVSGGSTSKAQSSVAAGTSVGVKQTALGKTLVDARGRTLYLFQADKPNRSALSPAGFSGLAGVHLEREAPGHRWRRRHAGRHDRRTWWQQAGDLQRPPALLLRRGPQPG